MVSVAAAVDVLRILLVEDNPMDIALVQEMLKQSQAKDPDDVIYDFRHAGSLAAAEPYWNSPIDLVLLDLSLPDSKGLATFMRAQALAGEAPIVVLTGLSDDQIALEAVRNGAQDYLIKWQMGARTLSRVLRYAVERKKGELEIRQVNEDLEKSMTHRVAALDQSRQRLRQSEKLATVGQLAAGIAHELNNPLSVILGFTQSLIQHPDAKDLPQALQSIEREALRCRWLVQQLLSFVRYRKAGMALEDPRAIVESALALVDIQASVHKVVLQKDFAQTLPKIRVDSDQIQQAIINLCTNAMDAMPRGGILGVRLQSEAHEVQIRVSDTGHGIAPEMRERIFQPFFTTKEFGKGTGLGLNLVSEIIGTHHGRLDLESELGKGSTFILHLPVAAAEN